MQSDSFNDLQFMQQEHAVLQNAENVINHQRTTISDLSKRVSDLEAENSKIAQKVAVTEKYIDENQRLRLHLDSLYAEMAVSSQISMSYGPKVAALQSSLKTAQREVIEKDQQLQEVTNKLHRLPKENEKLKEDILDLKIQIDKHCSKPDASLSIHQHNLKKQSKEDDLFRREATTAIRNTTNELRVTKRCFVQMESDLLLRQKTIQYQKNEIDRLNTIIANLKNNQGKLVSYHLDSTLDDKNEDRTAKSVKSVSIQTIEVEADGQISLKQSYRDRSALEAQRQRVLDDQNKLVQSLCESFQKLSGESKKSSHLGSKEPFYKSWVKYEKNLKIEENRRMGSHYIAVDSGVLYIYEPSEMQAAVENMVPACMSRLQAHRSDGCQLFPAEKMFSIRYHNLEYGSPETHNIAVETEDEYNRWYHALLYGGFITRELRQQTHQQPVPTPLEKRRSMFSGDQSREIEKRRSTFSGDESREIEKRPETVLPSYSDPVIKKCSKVLRIATNRIKTTQKQEILDKPTVHDQKSDTHLDTPESGHTKNELFVVENGRLDLYETVDSETPLLSLLNKDCVVTSNPDCCEFRFVHKGGTPEEETFIFNVADEAVFQNWLKTLEANGFMGKELMEESSINEVGVVKRGLLELYKHYGKHDATPVLSLSADCCVVTCKENDRTICIIYKAIPMKISLL